ncbi:hypothetical protein BGW41_002507 [Actinomortierella wolfii]|nr:hypothetical protein BGW41_002507 [Actinomortierella wolfii]
MTSKRVVTGDTVSASQLFTRQELVGRGAYGAVYKGIENATGQVVAIKVLNLDTEEEDVSDIQREIATLSQLKNCDSQNITRYHGSFLNGTKLWIVMDYAAGGSIRALVRMLALIFALYLQFTFRHDAANILLTEEGRVQLCDFGVAGQVTMTSLKRNSFVGTPYWMAPEVIKEGQTYDYKADIWSLGITIYEIATGNPPFADQDPMRAVFLIPRSRPVQLEGDWSPAMKEFVALCLHEEANQRPSAEDLLKTKWIKSTNKTTLGLLKDLVAKYEQVKAETARNKEDTKSELDIDHELESFDMESEADGWRFDTNKTMMASPIKSPSSRPETQEAKSDSLPGGQSYNLEDSAVAIQSNSKQSSIGHDGTNELGSPSVAKVKAAPLSPNSVPAQALKPAKTMPIIPSGGAGRDTHPLLRLFMTDKETEGEANNDTRPGGLVSSANNMPHPIPRQLTIPSLEDITHLRMAARSPSFPLDHHNHNYDQSASSSPRHQPPMAHRHNHPPQDQQHQQPPRVPFGFPSSKVYNFDRRPSAPVLATSHYQFQNQGSSSHRGEPSLPPLTSPRPMTPQPRSFLSNLHQRSDLSSSDTQADTTLNKPSQQHQLEDGLLSGSAHALPPLHRPGSTPASPRLPLKPPTSEASLEKTSSHQQQLQTLPPAAHVTPRPSFPRGLSPAPSPTFPNQTAVSGNHGATSLTPSIPHRKGSLDFSNTDRSQILRSGGERMGLPPPRHPHAVSGRAASFTNIFSGSRVNSGSSIPHSTSSASSNLTATPTPPMAASTTEGGTPSSSPSPVSGLSSGLNALSLQPINISEEKLPPFGHSPAHLRMLNVIPNSSETNAAANAQASPSSHLPSGTAGGVSMVHRGSIGSDRSEVGVVGAGADFTQSSRDSGASFGSRNSSHSGSAGGTAGAGGGGGGAFSSIGSSGPQPSMPSTSSTSNVAPVPLVRPGLRTVGSSENFARRIRSASLLRRTEEHEAFLRQQQQQQQAIGARPGGPASSPLPPLQLSSSNTYGVSSNTSANDDPLHPHGSMQIQLQPTAPAQLHPQFQYQQYSYSHDPSSSAEINRFRRASSPRRRSISMTNLNGGLMLAPSKKSSVDDYAPNPLLLPPSPSATRFIAPPTLPNSAMSSSPLRPQPQSMNSSNSITTIASGGTGGAAASSGTPMGHGRSADASLGVTPNHGQVPSSTSLASSTSSSAVTSSSLPTTQPVLANGQYPTTANTSQNRMHNGSVQNDTANVPPTSAAAGGAAGGSASSRGMIPTHLLLPPEPRPLQLDALRRTDDLYYELQLTMADLSQWLDVLDTGIKYSYVN